MNAETDETELFRTLRMLVRQLWIWVRPLVSILVATMLGLSAAVLFATFVRRLLETTIGWVNLLANWIAQLYPEASRPTIDRTDTLELGFAALGASLLVTTIRETLRSFTGLCENWTTATRATLLSAATTFFISFFGLGLSVYGLARQTGGSAETKIIYDSTFVAPAAADPETGYLTFYVSFGKEGGIGSVIEERDLSITLSDPDRGFLQSVGNALRDCRNPKTLEEDVKVIVRGYASSTLWPDAKARLEQLTNHRDAEIRQRAETVLAALRKTVDTSVQHADPEDARDEAVQYSKAFNVWLAHKRADAAAAAIKATLHANAFAESDLVRVTKWESAEEMWRDISIQDQARVLKDADRGILTRSVAITIQSADECTPEGQASHIELVLKP